ncbi:YhdP family protein [Marinimicrobium agarilyticum]|uniref:YhdP family protein n=1 Tax=Marinimicrobium agarilyticum TaxID=306546 RepID=UPI0004292EE2|nr:YhdP family protein [Marinimicrobium agarilyticum]
MVSVLAYLLKKFYILCAIVLIALAVVVQSGRSLFPLLERYDQELADYLSEQLGLSVAVGRLEAHWEDLTPTLRLHQLVVDDAEGHRLLQAESLLLRLNLLSSVADGRLAWDKVELQGPRLSLNQGPDGYWGLPDLTDQELAEEPLAPDDLLTLFQLGTRVEMLDARIQLTFANGHQQQFVAPYLLLEHQNDFHRLSLQIDIENRDRALVAVLEGKGDPRDPDTFHTEGYLQLREFPTLEPLTAIGGILFGESEHREWYREGQMNARLWFSSQEDGGYSWVGQLSLDEVALPLESLTLDRVSAGVSGEWARSGQWRLNLIDLSAEWRDRALEPLQVALSADATGAPVELLVDHINLPYWSSLAGQLGLLGDGKLREVLSTLNPQGHLRRVQLSAPQGEPGDWQLRAELEEVAVDPWQGVPGLTGVNGYVQASAAGGHVDLDSRNGFSMYFAKAYAEPMNYQSARGQVAWHLLPEQNQIYVNSGPLQLRGAGEQARGSMWLSLPWKRHTGDIDLYLDIHGEEFNVGAYRKYLPKGVPDSLRQWLDRSLGENNPGRAANAHFVFRGTLNRPGEPLSRSYQLALDMVGADLRYHPDWPALSDLSGQLVLNDNEVNARISQARLYNSQISGTRIHVGENPAGQGLLLTIDGTVEAPASDGLRLLREGYLRRYVNDSMDKWSAQGTVKANLDLAIPLEDGAPGARQDVAMELNLPRLTFGNLGLTLRDLTGPLYYRSGSGLSSPGIEGQLFGEPLQLSVASRTEQGLPMTEIAFSGRVSGERLAEWTAKPALRLLEGTTGFTSQLSLTHHINPEPDRDQRLASLALESDLEGMALNLPEPLGKSASERESLRFNLILGRQTALTEVHYGERLKALAQLDQQLDLQRLSVGVGVRPELPDEPGVRLVGTLQQLDVPAWREAIERYRSMTPPAAGAGTDALNALAGLPVQADIRLARHQVGPLLLENLQLNLTSMERGWRLGFDNEQLSGLIEWVPEQPLDLTLARVSLPESVFVTAEPSATAEPAEEFDPSQLPATDVSIARLTVGGRDYGRWRFELRPESNNIRIAALEGEIRGLTVTGSGDRGGRLQWYFGEGAEEHTRLQARVSAGDLSQVLQRFGQTDVLESQSADHQLNLRWPGPPQAVDWKTVSGTVDFEVLSGRFKRNPASGSDGLLRLFAVLNFDSLARRLRLDFSDLYQSGLAYDSIRGQMTLDQGQVVFSEPVLVRSPSSRLQLSGSADLIDETVDTRLVATLPVAGNLTFLTAVAAGLPAAAGVFLVSKLFEKQVDQATSISYTIEGDWDDPVIKFDRMFEGGAGLTNRESSESSDPSEEP